MLGDGLAAPLVILNDPNLKAPIWPRSSGVATRGPGMFSPNAEFKLARSDSGEEVGFAGL